MINPCFYYYFTTSAGQKVLTAKVKESGKGFDLTMEDLNENSSQLWMAKSADLEDVYYIYHCSSCLCLEATRDHTVHLHHQKGKDNQKFKFTKVSLEQSEFQISQYSKDARLLIKGNKVTCELTETENMTWKLVRAKQKAILLGSALIQSQISGYVLDVDDASQKEGALLLQVGWSGMFSQRWKFEKFKNFYLIRNVKSDKVITVKGTKSKVGSQLIQAMEVDSNHRHQLWSFEEKGYNTYSIRLASEQELFLGISDFGKEQSGIVLVRDAYKYLWKIVGCPDL